MFFNKQIREKRDRLRTEKLAIGQAAMLTAAMEAAAAAQQVTVRLRKELDQSNKKFEVTSRALNDGIILCDMDGTIQHANRSARKMFGPDLNEGRNVKDLFVRSEKIGSIDDLWIYLKDDTYSNPNNSDPLKGINHTGETFLINPKLEKIEWHDKRSSMVVVINDNMPVSDALSMFNETNDAIIICQGEKIIAVNANLEALLGYTKTELVNHDISIILSNFSYSKKINNKATIFDKSSKPVCVSYNVTDIIWNMAPAKIVVIYGATELKKAVDTTTSLKQKQDFVVVFNRDFRIITANENFFSTFGDCCPTNQDVRQIFDDETSSGYFVTVFDKKSDNVTRTQTVHFGKVFDWVDYIIYDMNGLALEIHRVGRNLTDILDGLHVIC